MKHEFFGQIYLDEQTNKKRVKLFQTDLMVDAVQRYDVGDRVIMKLETFYRVRTKKQQSVMHWYFGAIADHTGHTLDEIKQMMKFKFLRVPMTDALGNEVVDSSTGEVEMITKETRSLTTIESSEFCQQIRTWAYDVLNMELPEPDANWKLQLKNK